MGKINCQFSVADTDPGSRINILPPGSLTLSFKYLQFICEFILNAYLWNDVLPPLFRKSELITFKNYLYGLPVDSSTHFASSFLFSLLGFSKRVFNETPAEASSGILLDPLDIGHCPISAGGGDSTDHATTIALEEDGCIQDDTDIGDMVGYASQCQGGDKRESEGHGGLQELLGKDPRTLKTKDVKKLLADAPEEVRLREMTDGLKAVTANFYQVCQYNKFLHRFDSRKLWGFNSCTVVPLLYRFDSRKLWGFTSCMVVPLLLVYTKPTVQLPRLSGIRIDSRFDLAVVPREPI